MKYYLVALFNENSYKELEFLQEKLCKKHDVYKTPPVLHITLEVLDNPDIDKLDSIISKILKSYKKFKVEISGTICFDEPYKSVNLKVESKGYLNRIVRTINEKLRLNGFSVRTDISSWTLHVSLANTNFAKREWSKTEFSSACQLTTSQNFYNLATIDKIELWKPVNNKREMVMKTYSLKYY